MHVGVACLGGRFIVCSLVFSSWFVYISSFYNKVDASSSKTCIITCEELLIPWWTLAYLLVYIQNVLHAEYFVYSSRCPLILSTWFLLQETSLYGSPSSPVFSLLIRFSQREGKETAGWEIAVFVHPSQIPHIPFPFPSAGLRSGRAAFLY